MKTPVLLLLIFVAITSISAADAPAPVAALVKRAVARDEKLQRDFPDLCLDAQGQPWVCYVENDGKADTLQLGRRQGERIERVVAVSQPGVVHHPALAGDGVGGLWCVWGQVDGREVMTLRARRFVEGKLEEEETLASSGASDSFADAGTDKEGRVWVVWQSLRRGQADVFVRWLDPKTREWSREIAVSKPEGGNWEPRLAFDDRPGAWVAFDSSRGGEFNLYLARVALDGVVKEEQLTRSPAYEARAAMAWDRKGALWITAERGREQWGREQRGHEIETGFNGGKRLLLGRYDLAKGAFEEVPVFDHGRPAPFQMGNGAQNVNLPSVAVDAAGRVWIAYRACNAANWRVALISYDPVKQKWSESREVPESTMGQDRRNELTRAADGSLWLCWPSDLREKKDCGVSGSYLAQIDGAAALTEVPAARAVATEPLPEPAQGAPKWWTGAKPAPYVVTPAPDRPREQHDVWKVGGRTYHLVFGDLHRHTDVSNCRTGGDGCILEHFRYAYDMAGLDFLGTSDHTDVGKKMDPYEWWHTQRMVDAFFAPGKFASLYAYEREQPYPWGHRNIVFAKRGGPIVYIKRQFYRESPWQQTLPIEEAKGEITPMELWDVLERCGIPVAAISHTGATGMGTDWDKYEKIDGAIENTVEIFQGARVSYEGLGAPQPTIGLRRGERYHADAASEAIIPLPPLAIEDFGEKRNNGVYQRALADGHKLGVFASSDHISQHCSFGGVYVENFTREGIIEGFRARRSIAATDKIFVHLTCNDRPMGAVFATKEKPRLECAVDGTAPLERVTLVRNEQNYQVIDLNETRLERTFTDDAPIAGENRYYLRVEQTDGSMAWSSPVWVTFTP